MFLFLRLCLSTSVFKRKYFTKNDSVLIKNEYQNTTTETNYQYLDVDRKQNNKVLNTITNHLNNFYDQKMYLNKPFRVAKLKIKKINNFLFQVLVFILRVLYTFYKFFEPIFLILIRPINSILLFFYDQLNYFYGFGIRKIDELINK